MWKKLSTKDLLKHKRIHVVEDQVELPSGHKTDFVRLEIKGNAPCIIAVNDEGKILMQREYSYPVNEWLIQFPAGIVPFNEDLVEGANRELMEEAGYRANNLKLLGEMYLNNRRSNFTGYVFVATDLVEEKREGDIEESIETLWATEEEIDQMVKDGKIKIASMLAAWLLYKTSK